MAKEAKHPVKTTEKSLLIIETLQRLRGARIKDLAEELDMTNSAIHNHLSTLREHEYVVKKGDTYELGLKFLSLGGYSRNQYDLYVVGKSKVDHLAEETGELVNLLTEEHGKGVFLYQARGDQAVNIDTHTGSRLYLHRIALGKAILAHLHEERVEEIVAKHGLPEATENTITDADALFGELDEIREQGYAIDDEERDKGLQCVAAPILDEDNEVLGSISVSLPASRRGGKFPERIKKQVQSTSNMIELEIKYVDDGVL